VSVQTLIVDWLGRGGIAQATEAWAIELGAHGHDVEVVTRPGRELGAGAVSVTASAEKGSRLAAHRAVAQRAAEQIRASSPDWVVVQNYVVPPLERPVFAAARAVGAKVAVVVHDQRLHTWRAGTALGLASSLRSADVVVAHSEYVASSVRHDGRRDDVVVVPLPVPRGMLSCDGTLPEALAERGDARWCGHFGVVRRRYKGTEVVEQLARNGVDGWRFAILGAGARPGPGFDAVPGFLAPGDLVAAVSATEATIAPYTHATQSAVVVLAHALGSVPVASGVGGIPEQISNGIDGLLVEADAGIDAWRRALEQLRDDDYRKELATAGEARAWADHAAFVTRITELLR
jgi:glycosyltransferase involved in cell wall biosynthesis